MSVVRIIFVSFPPEYAASAEVNWHEECSPVMRRQQGCRSEQLLRCKDSPGEYISYSEWDNEESVKNYLNGEDHKEIKQHNRNIPGAQVVIKLYERV